MHKPSGRKISNRPTQQTVAAVDDRKSSTDTIVAIATPPGHGGIGIIRVSGSLAYDIGLKLTDKTSLLPHKVVYCHIKNQHEIIDTGLILFFKAPHSFTGEDIIELQVHGSPIILDALLSECIAQGARLAKPGEFSLRAFLNNKIDLTQAEAIADLITANSRTAARLALRSLQGEFSNKITALNQDLMQLRIFVEAAIDFPEEEIDFLSDGKVDTQLTSILLQLAAIRANASQGVMLQEGLTVVVTGPPNAGKSTLINRLAEYDVAIVTEIPGTTRDVLRAQIILDDLPLHIVDTAGLRLSDDIVEQEGIKRAWQEIKHADCVIIVVDINQMRQEPAAVDLNDEIRQALPSDVPIIKVFNKIDTRNFAPQIMEQEVYISAKSGAGLPLLKEKIKTLLKFQPEAGTFLARRRHLQALDRAQELLLAGQKQLQCYRAGELLAEDLRLAHQALCEITGTVTSDELLGMIFANFCIGK